MEDWSIIGDGGRGLVSGGSGMEVILCTEPQINANIATTQMRNESKDSVSILQQQQLMVSGMQGSCRRAVILRASVTHMDIP